MTGREVLKSLLPTISPLDINLFSRPLVYIGAAGFEDRAMSFLDFANSKKLNPQKAIAIEYLPFEKKNRIKEFREKLKKTGAEVKNCEFNRYDPQKFSNSINSLQDFLGNNHIIVDISGMSKFLIIILLYALRKGNNPLTIIYGEAEIYHPTKKQVEQEKKKLGSVPDFLTSDVYGVLTVSSLSSVSMQGYPILMIAFPTFNHFELVALYNEMSPNHMILLEGVPHERKDKWRLQAIREINRNVIESVDYSTECKELSTFDYLDTLEALEGIYSEHSYNNKIVLAPTGSKLQTVASSMFKIIHPDIQIIYPVTKCFKLGEFEYSEKCKALWCIHFDDYEKFASTLDEYRKQK